jgi:hypothetical protein
MNTENKNKQNKNYNINNNSNNNNLDYEEEQLKLRRNINDLQKEIAKAISKEAKSEDDLLKQFPNIKYDLLVQALKTMLSLKLIKKQGFPVKYSLSDEISKKIIERREISENDKNQMKISILIESKSDDKGKLRKAMEEISSKLKEDKTYLVYDLETAEILVQDDLFSTYISAEVSCATLNDLLRLIYFYGVTSIEVLKPNKLQIPISDLQQSLLTIVDMTQGYAQMIFSLRNKINSLEKLLKNNTKRN